MSNSISPESAASVESEGAVALRECLHRGSTDGVMALFKSMDAKGVATALREAGFVVDEDVIALGRSAVFAAARDDLNEAIEHGIDGFGLQRFRQRTQLIQRPVQRDVPVVTRAPAVAAKFDAIGQPLNFKPAEFDGNVEAARVIQKMMRGGSMSVTLMGDAPPSERAVLMMIAGQALAKKTQVFEFEGIPGKYEVPLTLAKVHSLNQDAAQAVAIESVRSSMDAWVKGAKIADINEWVSDSVLRVLQGSVNLAAVKAVVGAVETGAVASRAKEIGASQSATLLASHGLDVNAPTVQEQAAKLGLTIIEPNKDRGRYFGFVVGTDHRACLLKPSRSEAIELDFAEFSKVNKKPAIGDSISLRYSYGELTATVAERASRSGQER